MKTKPNDKVFPNEASAIYGGLSKREHFSAFALQGLLANGLFQVNADFTDHKTKLAALTAVQAADALIDQLNWEEAKK